MRRMPPNYVQGCLPEVAAMTRAETVLRHIVQRAKAIGEPVVFPAGYMTVKDPPSYSKGYHAVDLDGTIATHTSNGSVGKPISAMVERVKKLLADGKDVRIFTARKFDTTETRQAIESWCEEHIGKVLPITNVKHPGMRAFYDDKGVSVVKNTGELRHPLTPTMKAEAEEGAMENDETQELAGNPYHAKDGKFTTAGGMKGKPAGKAGFNLSSKLAKLEQMGFKVEHERAPVTGINAEGPRLPHEAAVLGAAIQRHLGNHAGAVETLKRSLSYKNPSSPSGKVDSMSASSFTSALRAVTGRHDYTAVERGSVRQIVKDGPNGPEVVRAKTWSAALRLATAKWGTKR